MPVSDVSLPASGPGTSPGRRVVLLARPGPAREHLRQALHEAGAVIVLEDDPNTLDGQALDDASPQVVLVALESAIEDSLSRFDHVLHDPSVAVIFDEAELAARREGWEAKRWARHLSAKLNGHADVLPPGGELDATQPEPGLPPTPAQIHADAAIQPHLEEARDIASELPRGGLEATVATSVSTLELTMEPEGWQPPVGLGRGVPPLDGFEPQATEPRSSLELESLEPVSSGNGRRGAVVLLAGIGGPDAVRKLLAELPAEFPHPILVQLRLDGGRYDNLVKQMGRISALPVHLAKAGEIARAAHVYVLPNDVAVTVNEGALHFAAGALVIDDLIAALPPAESAVLLLSGSDPSQVDVVIGLAAQGGFVAGQSPQGCYDPAASKALAARGGEVATPAELAARLVAHWAG